MYTCCCRGIFWFFLLKACTLVGTISYIFTTSMYRKRTCEPACILPSIYHLLLFNGADVISMQNSLWLSQYSMMLQHFPAMYVCMCTCKNMPQYCNILLTSAWQCLPPLPNVLYVPLSCQMHVHLCNLVLCFFACHVGTQVPMSRWSL